MLSKEEQRGIRAYADECRCTICRVLLQVLDICDELEQQLTESQAENAVMRPFVEKQLLLLQNQIGDAEYEIRQDIHHGWQIGRQTKEDGVEALKRRAQPLKDALSLPNSKAYAERVALLEELVLLTAKAGDWAHVDRAPTNEELRLVISTLKESANG